jgi:hypothetical protein
MTHWLARIDAAQQRWDDAVARFSAALEAEKRLGARPWAVLTRAGLAAALRARAAPGDATRADDLLVTARREADAIGMAVLGAVDIGEAAEPEVSLFRFDGQVWTLRYAGKTVHLPDAKGLHDLRTLLQRPGVEVAAADLLDPAGGPVAAARSRLGADPVLDDRARAA